MAAVRSALAALVILIALLVASGCGANEPDSFVVRFENDLTQPVVLSLCHSDHSAKCEHPYYRDHIAPGVGYPENISPDVRTEWAIETADGELLRCVVLYWKHYPGETQHVRMSTAPRWAVPCPRPTPAVGEYS